MQVIGLLGVKGAGKDTAAKYLIEQRNYRRTAFADKLYREVADTFGITVEQLSNRDTKELPLAILALKNCREPLFTRCVLEESGQKRLLTKMGPDGRFQRMTGKARAFLEKPRSPRFIMQLWGTEFRRRRGVDSYWLDIVGGIIKADPSASYVITDVRFINEAKFIRAHNGLLLRVRRPVLEAAEAANRAANGTAAHPSETEMLTYPVDAELLNLEGRPDSLRDSLDELFGRLSKAA